MTDNPHQLIMKNDWTNSTQTFYVHAEIKDMPVDNELSILIDETHFIVGIFYYLFKQYPEHLNYFDDSEVNPMNFKKTLSGHALAARSWIG